ncbi:HipA-like protein [Caulobacter sp. AP07]|uniref:type II toxin-antitoxin system HipA family toxin n=1 Tax=Caulobacter sp. AP07 TaxID=1144304 RepID=UPI0002721186|nr:type II toxin-antitoxin system HipA family toxin [Caulobacter sp. AP07]EJL27376.1 HipA-like protein [Caulobacter sp. AP07]
MDRDLEVYLDWDGETLAIGRLWARARGARESASFEYDRGWLGRPDAFALDPNLPLASGQHQWAGGLFNAFTDCAPDRWGRNLMTRRERRLAKAEGRAPRALLDADCLALVEDETRMGALRFRDVGEAAFLSQTDRPVPPLVALPRLLSAAGKVIADKESDDDLRLLLAPGSSLGGARPKASVRDGDGALLIAKFPSQTDDWPIPRWEATAMDLAGRAGIEVPPWRLETVARRPVFMMRRFDREPGGRRVAFMSALTALSAADGQSRSYLELVDILRQAGAEADRDAAQLWRRMVFNILISNTDDHLRNHGYLRDARGWRLSPAYDLNPMPADVKPRIHALALNETDDDASLDTALSVAPAFGLTHAQAVAIAGEVGAAVSDWRAAASRNGLSAAQIERMESAFQHEDLDKAVGARPLAAPPRRSRR